MVHVLCFGSLLHGDDSFGIHVHRRLASRSEAGGIKLIDAGIRGIDALALLDRPSHVILVDALHDAHSPPGAIRVIEGGELDTGGAGYLHGGGVSWLAQAIRASITPAPRVTLVGAVVHEVQGFVPHLSPLLANRLDEVATLVERLAAAGGHRG